MTTNRISVPVSAEMPFKVGESGDLFLARCELLKITGAGKNEQWAIQNLKDSIAGIFEGALEDGKMQILLSECGLKQTRKAGVVVWEAPPELAAKYAQDRNLELVVTLHPRIEVRESAEDQIDPVVISAMARIDGSNISN